MILMAAEGHGDVLEPVHAGPERAGQRMAWFEAAEVQGGLGGGGGVLGKPHLPGTKSAER